MFSEQQEIAILGYFPTKASPRLLSVQRINSLSFIHDKLSFANFTFVHTVTWGVEGDRQLLQSKYKDREGSSMMKEI